MFTSAAHFVKIDAPARLHLGLIGLSAESTRAFGGAGLAISHRRTVVNAESSVSGEISISGLDAERAALLRGRLIAAGVQSINLNVETAPPPHRGFGSGTSIVLSSLEAALVLTGKNKSHSELILLSGRGGASGIGVSAYFYGGFIFELGHKTAQPIFFPSSARSDNGVQPAVMHRVDWPDHWSITVAYPADAVGLAGQAEREFMQAHLPLPLTECALASFALCFELPSAIADRDYESMRLALRRSRHTGFKKIEIARFSNLAAWLDKLDNEYGLATSMSSFGPAILIVSERQHSQQIQSAIPSSWQQITGVVSNSGRVLTMG
jgi:beta-ribofuranosylaminobenzene 5'-phosphate synthase